MTYECLSWIKFLKSLQACKQWWYTYNESNQSVNCQFSNGSYWCWILQCKAMVTLFLHSSQSFNQGWLVRAGYPVETCTCQVYSQLTQMPQYYHSCYTLPIVPCTASTVLASYLQNKNYVLSLYIVKNLTRMCCYTWKISICGRIFKLNKNNSS